MIRTTENWSRLAALLIAGSLAVMGCETGGQTGALAGAGLGALVGQAIGGDTGATLIGAAAGSGIGYIIGNESDKKHAKQMGQTSQPTSAPVHYPHNEVGSLGGTKWALVSLAPRDFAPPYTSKIVEFRPDGRVITTTTKPDGQIDVFNESYRVVGSTLIVNKPGYLINARFSISGDQLIVDAEEFRAVLKRLAA